LTEAEERQAVIAEARTWLRTPWHHGAKVKGAGVDCAMLLIACYSAAGLISDFTPEHYPIDWAMHRDQALFDEWLSRFAHLVDTPGPGDVAHYRFGRVFSHAAIVVDWPLIIHASMPTGIVTLDHGDQDWLTRGPSGTDAPVLKFWSLWPRPAQ
jgi:cell wall-associated NlpC family hydrolase